MPHATAGPRDAPRPMSFIDALRSAELPLATPPVAPRPSPVVARLARFSEQPNDVAAVVTVATLLADLPGYSAVDMGGWLDNLVHGFDAAYGRPGGPSLSCSTTTCKVPTGQAIALGLITDLLVSDACVHGFRPGDGGRIAVSMVALESMFELTIDDSGLGAAQGRAAGATIARRLARQLGGWFETPKMIGGKRYIITVPRETIRLSS